MSVNITKQKKTFEFITDKNLQNFKTSDQFSFVMNFFVDILKTLEKNISEGGSDENFSASIGILKDVALIREKYLANFQPAHIEYQLVDVLCDYHQTLSKLITTEPIEISDSHDSLGDPHKVRQARESWSFHCSEKGYILMIMNELQTVCDALKELTEVPKTTIEARNRQAQQVNRRLHHFWLRISVLFDNGGDIVFTSKLTRLINRLLIITQRIIGDDAFLLAAKHGQWGHKHALWNKLKPGCRI